MTKEQRLKKKIDCKKTPKISKKKVLPENKRKKSNKTDQKRVANHSRNDQPFQRERLLRHKDQSRILTKFYEALSVSQMKIYDLTCNHSYYLKGQENSVHFKITSRQLRDFLGINQRVFLQLLNMMVKPNVICIEDALRMNYRENFLDEEIERSFVFGFCAFRKMQGSLSQKMWLSLSQRQIMTVYIISLLLQGVQQTDSFTSQIDYPKFSTDSEQLTRDIFKQVQFFRYFSVEKLLSQTKLLTPNVFNYLVVNFQMITKLVREQILDFQQGINPQLIITNYFPELTWETLSCLSFVRANQEPVQIQEKSQNQRPHIINSNVEKIRQQSVQNDESFTLRFKSRIEQLSEEIYSMTDQNRWFDIGSYDSSFNGKIRSHDEEFESQEYFKAIGPRNEPNIPQKREIQPINQEKALKLYFYGREKKRNRQQQTRRNVEIKNQTKNKEILQKRLQCLEERVQKTSDLNTQQIEEMRYLTQFLSVPQQNTYLINKTKICPEVLKKLKFPSVRYHEIKHQNREIDELIRGMIQNEMAIAQSVANHIYHSLVAYKIHLRPEE